MTPRLNLHELRVNRGGHRVIDLESFALDAGELCVLAGDAGSGKTTLARALLGDLAAQGAIEVDGLRLGGPPSARRRRGVAGVADDGRRLRGGRAHEVLRLAATAGRRADRALELFPALALRSGVDAAVLSGGEHQMLRIAAAWLAEPSVLVLDAAGTGLAASVVTVLHELARAEAERGCAVLWLDQGGAALPLPPTHRLEAGGGVSPTLSPRETESSPTAE